jgi:hypothetical protein
MNELKAVLVGTIEYPRRERGEYDYATCTFKLEQTEKTYQGRLGITSDYKDPPTISATFTAPSEINAALDIFGSTLNTDEIRKTFLKEVNALRYEKEQRLVAERVASWDRAWFVTHQADIEKVLPGCKYPVREEYLKDRYCSNTQVNYREMYQGKEISIYIALESNTRNTRPYSVSADYNKTHRLGSLEKALAKAVELLAEKKRSLDSEAATKAQVKDDGAVLAGLLGMPVTTTSIWKSSDMRNGRGYTYTAYSIPVSTTDKDKVLKVYFRGNGTKENPHTISIAEGMPTFPVEKFQEVLKVISATIEAQK